MLKLPWGLTWKKGILIGKKVTEGLRYVNKKFVERLPGMFTLRNAFGGWIKAKTGLKQGRDRLGMLWELEKVEN